jgi:hypothetical protein
MGRKNMEVKCNPVLQFISANSSPCQRIKKNLKSCSEELKNTLLLTGTR